MGADWCASYAMHVDVGTNHMTRIKTTPKIDTVMSNADPRAGLRP